MRLDFQTEIRQLEEISLNAWPARRQLFDSGWIIRISEGVTGRANSITPLYGSEESGADGQEEIEKRIERWESVYRQEGLQPLFRLTTPLQNSQLDRSLQERGYRSDAGTAVLLAELSSAVDGGQDGYEVRHDTELEEWIEMYRFLNGKSRREGDGLKAICRRILWPTSRLLLRYENEVIGCGLGVRQGLHIGLFNIAVTPSERRRGHGRRLVESLLTWGVDGGARLAYLQVERDNLPALALYEQLGFAERYGYYYRSAPQH